jgi:hypothetical protein
MKKVIFILTIFWNLLSYSQTPINVYVVHQGCTYGVTDTWTSQCAAGNMVLDSVDYQGFQDLYFYHINDTCYPIQLTMCVYVGATQAPFPPQTPFCLTQNINGGGAITLLADCSILGLKENLIVPRKLVRIQNLFGQPASENDDQLLIYIYDDGTSEKVFIVK